jgi:hypothetical protein
LTVLSGRPHCLVRLLNDWKPKPLSPSLKPNSAEAKAPRCEYPGLMTPGLVKQSCKGREQLRQRHALVHTHTLLHTHVTYVCMASASKVVCHAFVVMQ